MADASLVNADLVSTGKPLVTGSIFVSKVSSVKTGTASDLTIPKDATTALGDKFWCLGHIAKDSVSTSNELSTTSHEVWGGVQVLNTRDSFAETYSFTCVEYNKAVMSTIWGSGNVSGSDTEGLDVYHSPDGFDGYFCFVIMVVHSNGSLERIIIPKGKVTALDTTNYHDTELISYPITITALAGGFDDKPLATSRSISTAPGYLDTLTATVANTNAVSPVAKVDKETK